MGILDRFSTIMKSNINALLDKAENPEKIVDQLLRDAVESLAKVKQETASVMAEETRTKRILDSKTKEAGKYENAARNAIKANADDKAEILLRKKMSLDAEIANATETFRLAKANADKMREMHDKLVNDINQLNSRKAMVKSKVAVARTQDTINKLSSKTSAGSSAMTAFERMEAKADAMLDKSSAMTELNSQPVDEAEALLNEFQSGGSSSDVSGALEQMKREMGCFNVN